MLKLIHSNNSRIQGTHEGCLSRHHLIFCSSLFSLNKCQFADLWSGSGSRHCEKWVSYRPVSSDHLTAPKPQRYRSPTFILEISSSLNFGPTAVWKAPC